MRSLAKPFRAEGIRVNSICPGLVRTNLIDPKLLEIFPQVFTDLERVTETVLQLVDGGEQGQGMTDAWGTHVPAARLFGLAVEISDNGNVYFRDPHKFADDGMELFMGGPELTEKVEVTLKEE